MKYKSNKKYKIVIKRVHSVLFFTLFNYTKNFLPLSHLLRPLFIPFMLLDIILRSSQSYIQKLVYFIFSFPFLFNGLLFILYFFALLIRKPLKLLSVLFQLTFKFIVFLTHTPLYTSCVVHHFVNFYLCFLIYLFLLYTFLSFIDFLLIIYCLRIL